VTAFWITTYPCETGSGSSIPSASSQPSLTVAQSSTSPRRQLGENSP